MGAIQSKVTELYEKHGNGNVKLFSIIAFALILLQNTIGRSIRDRMKGLPPGPIPMPVIGTFYELSPPNTQPGIHKDMFRLSKKWGPIFTLYFGANRGVVLNSPELYYEALKVKQDETANRPLLKSFEAITHGQGIAMNNGPRWRDLRTMLQQTVTNKQLGEKAEPVIMEEVCSTLAGILEQTKQGKYVTENLRLALRRESMNIIMRKLFSVRFKEEMTPTYLEVQDWLRVIFEHLAQGSPSDFMPIMKYLPNAEEDHYRKVCIDMENFIDAEIARHRKELPSKKEQDYDFIDKALLIQAENKKKGEDLPSDIDIRVITFDSMAGGLDTSATSMEWLILTLAKYPMIQEKLHKIFDEVVGPDRLPTLADEPKLEYLTACLDELFRWKHFAPHGLPHEAAVDLELGGYKVPKGTQIFFNYYSLHMNEKDWRQPEVFRPERFLEEEKALLKTVLHSETFFTDPSAYKYVPFGQGRRRCVGYGFGRIVIWLMAAYWVHCFDFAPIPGKEIDIDTEILAITMLPLEQQVRITPRPAARLLKKYHPQAGILEI